MNENILREFPDVQTLYIFHAQTNIKSLPPELNVAKAKFLFLI